MLVSTVLASLARTLTPTQQLPTVYAPTTVIAAACLSWWSRSNLRSQHVLLPALLFLEATSVFPGVVDQGLCSLLLGIFSTLAHSGNTRVVQSVALPAPCLEALYSVLLQNLLPCSGNSSTLWPPIQAIGGGSARTNSRPPIWHTELHTPWCSRLGCDTIRG